MENNFTPEQMEKARAARSPEELLSLAKESGLELSEEQANTYFEKLNKSGELSDDELDNVAGGGCGHDKPLRKDMHYLLDDPNFRLVNTRCPECGGQVGVYESPGETIFICVDCGNNAVKHY